jgi:hypothetical protein
VKDSFYSLSEEMLLERLAELDAKIAAAKQWGALLTALSEERQGILRAIAEEQR